MSIYLIFDGVNDVVTLPTTMVCNTGNTSWVWEFSIAISSYPASGNRYFTGAPSGTTNSGFCLRQASGNGALALVVAGVNVAGFTSPTGYILDDGALHTYRVERDAGADVRFYRDSSLIATVSWVTGSIFTLNIGRFGSGSTATSGITEFNLEYFDFVSGFSDAEKWDSNLSGGTGSILPTVSGNNQGALVNFPTDNSQWGGTGTSATFAGTLPKLTAAISATVTSGISASFSGTLPKLTAAISADVTFGISASFAGTLPKLQASINATVSAGTDSLSFSGTLPKLSASISATVSAAPNSLSFSGALPKLRASISATVSLPPPLVAFSGALPRLRMQAAMIVQVPEPAGDPLALKQALVNARRAEENRNNEYVPPVVIVPEWYIIQQRALGLKQGEVNRARDEE